MKFFSTTHLDFSWLSLLAMVLGLAGLASAQQKTELKDHAFYKHMIGEWSSEGERKYTDGRVVKIKQEWKTEVLSADSLTMEGTRDRDGQSNHYRWTITQMDNGLIEAVYQPDTSKPDTQRYEVQAPEDGSHVEMMALLDNNSKITNTETLKEGDPDTLESTVTRTDATGATVYTSTSVAKRKKS